MLPQTVPATGALLSRSGQVRRAARAQNTVRAYLGHHHRRVLGRASAFEIKVFVDAD